MNKNSLAKSFQFAFQGLRLLWQERNFRIHLAVAFLVMLLAFILGVSKLEWLVLILCITVVLVLEGVNTAIELLCDKVTTAFDPQIGKIKDIAAGSVLIAAGCSVIIGCIIFLPKMLLWL